MRFALLCWCQIVTQIAAAKKLADKSCGRNSSTTAAAGTREVAMKTNGKRRIFVRFGANAAIATFFRQSNHLHLDRQILSLGNVN